MPTNQERLTQLVQAGWTVEQAGAYITTGVMPAAAGQVAATKAVVPYAPGVPFVAPGVQAYTPQVTVKPGDTPPAGFELSDVIGPIAGTLGLGAVAVAAPLATAYGISELIGVQYPWQTGPGEGFIAPWNRNIVRDEQGMWVTPNTRPDLFPPEKGGTMGAPGTGMMVSGAGMGMGAQVVKQWSAGGWPFAMTSDGKIHTVTKSGVRKSWRPYRSVVLGKNPSPAMLSRAVTKMIKFDKLHSKIQKMARRIKT